MVTLINLNGIVITASHENVPAVRSHVEIPGMRARLLIAHVSQHAAGTDLKDDDPVATQAEAGVEEFAVRRKVDIRSAARIHAVCLDDLLFCQGTVGIIVDSDVTGEFSNDIQMLARSVKQEMPGPIIGM